MNLAYLSGYTKLDKQQILSGSLRYFSLGQVTFRNDNGESQGIQNPNEFAIDFGYTRLLSDNFSGSVVFRYIRSDLGTVSWGTQSLRPGNAFAADISFYYQKELNSTAGKKVISTGVNVSNLGSKISYESGVNYLLPANLRLGIAYSTELDTANKLTFALDANKLLVPSQKNDTLQGGGVVIGGSSSDKSVLDGALSSFTDVGLKEELQEITIGVGCEYLYNKQFALRTGYFYENQNNGNRKYFTAGAGLKLNAFSLDFAYLVPTQQNNPLENTLRFTLSFDLGQFRKAIGN
jgi:long-subunit fatty acid transport protein